MKKGIKQINGLGAVVAYVLLCIVLAFANKSFLTLENMMLVLRQASWIGLLSIATTFLISMGGIDLSIGANVGICGLACAVMIHTYHMNIYLAILLTIGFGMVLGYINGLLITLLHLPEFIATLGTMSIMRGLIYVYTKGVPVYGLRYPEFQFVAQGYLFDFLPMPVFILIVFAALFYVVLFYTKLGRYTVSIGSNAEAAKLVGIPVDRVRRIVFLLTGMLAAVAGIILTSRSEAATPTAGEGFELNAIAATVIGGTSMSGGKANLVGAIIGAVLMATINNGLNLLNVDSLWQKAVIGAFIIFAVAADTLSNRNAKD